MSIVQSTLNEYAGLQVPKYLFMPCHAICYVQLLCYSLRRPNVYMSSGVASNSDHCFLL